MRLDVPPQPPATLVETPESLVCFAFSDSGYPRRPPGPRPRAEMQQRLSERALAGPPGFFPPVSVSVPLPSRPIASIAPKFSLCDRPILFHSGAVSPSHGRAR